MNKFNLNRALPFEATHAGDLVKDELAARGITQTELAEITGMQKAVLNNIIAGRRAVSPAIALMFEDALGIPATLLLNVQKQYELDCARMEWERHAQTSLAVGHAMGKAQPVLG